jgi:(heptosyl)LPS beta-1,4-glucosyltransferase
MRLGGFVIHGDAAGIISPCLDSLAAVCDQVVTVDTGSRDRTAELASARGFSVLRRPWEGFGAARAEAIRALKECDWVLFLDSDEWLGPEARDVIRRFKEAPPALPCVALPRRNWADVNGRRFVYHHEHPVRLARRDHARFERSQIVHEVVPPGPTLSLQAVIEHDYVISVESLRAKLSRYALLWALRHHALDKRPGWPSMHWSLHMVRDLLVRRAAFTGRPEAFQIAAAIADYHALKYALLREMHSGRYAGLVGLLREDRLEELFRALPAEVEPERQPFLSWVAGLPSRLG